MDRTLEALDREWQGLAFHPGCAETVRHWAETHPVLAGARNPGGVLLLRRDPELARPVLAALAELAADDWLAARTLLQALIPGVIRLANRVGASDPFAIDEMVALAWERICTYPTRRPGSVAGNVLWDVRKAYQRRRFRERPRGEQPIDETVRAIPDKGPPPDEEAERFWVLEAVWRARRSGLISDEAARLIVRTRLQGAELGEVAADSDIDRSILKKRRARAEQRLRDLLTG